MTESGSLTVGLSELDLLSGTILSEITPEHIAMYPAELQPLLQAMREIPLQNMTLGETLEVWKEYIEGFPIDYLHLSIQ